MHVFYQMYHQLFYKRLLQKRRTIFSSPSFFIRSARLEWVVYWLFLWSPRQELRAGKCGPCARCGGNAGDVPMTREQALEQVCVCVSAHLLHCSTLQHTATHCYTLLHTAAHCSTLQHTATHCNTLQHIATHCNTLQHTATHCNTLQHNATRCNTLEHAATHCNTTTLDPDTLHV